MKNPNLTRVSGIAQHLCCACTIATVFAVCAATKAFGFEATSTMARGYPAPFDIDQPWTPHKAHGHSNSKIGDAPSAPGAKSVEIVNLERPLFAVISIADQHVSIYNNQGLVARSAISTGMPGHPTPKGVFTIIGRERYHRSNIYSDAPMPFMQRITWSGIAMHLGVVPGHPASHGCIRLPAEFAAKLWGLTRLGERVVISPQEVTPIEFTHPMLPAPKMRVARSSGSRLAASGSRLWSAASDQSASIRRTAQGQGCCRKGRGRQFHKRDVHGRSRGAAGSDSLGGGAHSGRSCPLFS